MVRVIAGQFKGRLLKVPDGKGVRPITDRVKESVFNILENELLFNELTVIDLYAGSGAFGIESLSRGASHTIFVEQAFGCVQVIKQNLETLGLSRIQGQIIQKAVVPWLRSYTWKPEPHLIFFDPPYHEGQYDILINTLNTIMTPSHCWIVGEIPESITLAPLVGFERFRIQKYGQTHVHFFRSNPTTHEVRVD